jgi:7-cyano-7-deazaguanine synthase
MHRRKQFVLFSGGLDSATVLYHAMANWPQGSISADEREPVDAVSIDYGQRHSREIAYAHKITNELGIHHTILKAPAFMRSGSMLTDNSRDIPNASYAELPDGISPTYVPFRNGLMISMLAGYAQKWVMAADSDAPKDYRRATIYIGAHADDAARDAYPDCSREFIQHMQDAVRIGTYEAVKLEAPLVGLEKSEVVRMGEALKVPFDKTWSCYKGEDLHCGVCPTCRSRKEAFIKAGITDPTTYAG